MRGETTHEALRAAVGNSALDALPASLRCAFLSVDSGKKCAEFARVRDCPPRWPDLC